MSNLIFCSYEVGGFPFQMAKLLNLSNNKTFYISIDIAASNHDSTEFHFGKSLYPWDLSDNFKSLRTKRKIINLLKYYINLYKIKNCLATGSLSYLIKEAGLDYTYWTYGSDFDQIVFSSWWKLDYHFWTHNVRSFFYIAFPGYKARRSFALAHQVHIAPYQKQRFKSLFPDKKLVFIPHFLHCDPYDVTLQKREVAKTIIKNKYGVENFIFSPTRHVWGDNYVNSADNKRNDIIIKAFKAFIDIVKENIQMVFIDKGPSVGISKDLIKNLSLEQNVQWLPEMPRRDLDQVYQAANVCLVQFGTPVTSFASVEPLAFGTPTISRFIEEKEIPYYSDFPPITNSYDVTQIADRLRELFFDYQIYKKLSYSSWHWVNHNASEKVFVEVITKLLNDSRG